MKKICIVIVSFLLSSCDSNTCHSYYFENLSSDTLELRYKSVFMERLIDTVIEPNVLVTLESNGLSDPRKQICEPGEEDRLSDQCILDHFKVLEVIKDSDTILLDIENTSISDSNEDWDFFIKTYFYTIEVSNESLD